MSLSVPASTICCCNPCMSTESVCPIESTRFMIWPMSAAAGPGGTVSPGEYEAAGTGIGGVSATATSPKMPTGFTVAVDPFGIVYWSSMRSMTSRISVAAQVHVAHVADAHAGEQHGLPLLQVLAPREPRVERIARV